MKMQISGTLQDGLNVIPGGTCARMITGATDVRRLSDLSLCEATVYPSCQDGIDKGEPQVDATDNPATDDGQGSQTQETAKSSQHSSSLNFNPLFGEDVIDDGVANGEAAGELTSASAGQ
jgi:hypothetical protein